VNDVPGVWAFVLLALGVFRIYRLIAEDTILDWPRRRLLRLGDEWMREGDKVPDEFREKWSLFITCPWCLGWWLALGAWLLWLWQPHWTLVGMTPFAISAVVALTAKNLDQPEEE
jgi:hypothetical protein